jgi:hypothetical protein
MFFLQCKGSDSVTLLDTRRAGRHSTYLGPHCQSCWRVEAELCGRGSKPWSWAIYSSDTWLAADRSEPMFRTSEAARRVGALIVAQLDPGSKPRRSELH